MQNQICRYVVSYRCIVQNDFHFHFTIGQIRKIIILKNISLNYIINIRDSHDASVDTL